MNKEDSSPSLRCVCCPKVEIFVEMFRAKLLRLVWSRHIGGPPYSSKGDPETRNDGMAKWRKIAPNPKRWNGGKSPQILKDGMAENRPKS